MNIIQQEESMGMASIISRVRKDLRESADARAKAGFQRFFKEKVRMYGVSTGIVMKIAARHWKESVRALGKGEVFGLCEELLKSGYCEEAFVVSAWMPRLAGSFEEKDLEVFRSWIEKYIDNWAKCDSFCNHTVGDFMQKYPQRAAELKKWAKSGNRWMRRAAAVSLIVPAKKGGFLKEAFEISGILLLDADDMVQKGYGWLLKEESRTHRKEVFDYVVKHKGAMPRTALRYAIELMPQEMRQAAMARE